MKNSIYILTLFVLTPFTNWSMHIPKNTSFYNKNNEALTKISTRTQYSKSINYLEEKLKFVQNEESKLVKECSTILKKDITVYEKAKLIEKNANLLNTIGNLKYSLTLDLEELTYKNFLYNTIITVLQTTYTNACKTEDVKEAVKLLQKIFEQEKNINAFKEELNEKYFPIFQDIGFKLPEE